MSCEDEAVSTPTECRFVREPTQPNADGSCPSNYEKITGFLRPACLPIAPSSYTCLSGDPRLCTRPRRMPTTYPPLTDAYPLLPT